MLRVVFARGFYAPACCDREVVRGLRHAVDQLHEVFLVAEGDFKTVRVLLVDQSELIALTCPGEGRSERDRIESVVVGVEVGLDRPVGIKNSDIGPESGCRLIFGSVDHDFFALPGAGLEREVIHRLGACERASVPATVSHSLAEKFDVLM